MIYFLKGLIVGFGGISPGLSGSVLLIIFGLYYRTLDALGSLFRDFRKHITFLLPLLAGMLTGVLLFSGLLDFLLENHEVPTRFCFLGLILGTVPMFYREAKKEGFSPVYYGVILAAATVGTLLFTVNPNAFPQITQPNMLQCIVLGVCVAATAIVPGVDPAVLLSTLGLYEAYISALADLNFSVLLPLAAGAAVGAVAISRVMAFLFSRFYTPTYCSIFGLFLAMIPNILTAECTLGPDGRSVLSLGLALAGFALSFYLGDVETNNRKLRQLLAKFSPNSERKKSK